MIWRTTSWCQIIFKWSKGDWNTSSMFRTFPKMFKCFQNRSKQTVVKSAKSLKLENTLVSLKTQIPAKTVVKTQCHRNSIQWNTVHSRTFSAHQKCRISMNTDVKCSRSIIQWTIVQRRPAHAKPDFNWLSGPRNGTWKRTCGISCLRSLAPMRRLQCSTTQATFTNPSLLRATPLLRGMF